MPPCCHSIANTLSTSRNQKVGEESSDLSVRSSCLVAKAPNRNTDSRYIIVVKRVAYNVPIGIELCVSLSEAERFEPAMIPVTAGKKRPNNALKDK